MSFTYLGPFSYGSKVSSAVFNQLCSDVANALDKTVAGDTLSGVVTMASTAQIDVSHAGASIVSSVENGIYLTAIKSLVASVSQAIMAEDAGAITSLMRGGITPGVAGGINDGGVSEGIVATVAKGICDGGIVNGIAATVAGGISDGGVASGLSTTTAGGLRLGGGASDWPTFSATRGRNDTFLIPSPRVLSSGWAWNTLDCQSLVGPATSEQLIFPLDFLHQGATLVGLYLIFGVQTSHSDVPANLPTMGVFRFPIGPGVTAASAQNLYSASGGFQTFGTAPASPSSPPGTGAAWYDSGLNQAFGFIPNQNNVIDRANYIYTVILTDEYGSNSIAGNFWYSIAPLYSGIGSLQFP